MKNSAISKKISSVLSDGPVSGIDISYILSLAGISRQDVARQAEADVQTVSDVIHGRCKSFNVATKIAELTGVPMNRLWPGAYDYTPRKRNAA